MREFIFLARGSGKIYFVKRHFYIPRLIKDIEKIKEKKNES